MRLKRRSGVAIVSFSATIQCLELLMRAVYRLQNQVWALLLQTGFGWLRSAFQGMGFESARVSLRGS